MILERATTAHDHQSKGKNDLSARSPEQTNVLRLIVPSKPLIDVRLVAKKAGVYLKASCLAFLYVSRAINRLCEHLWVCKHKLKRNAYLDADRKAKDSNREIERVNKIRRHENPIQMCVCAMLGRFVQFIRWVRILWLTGGQLANGWASSI